MFIHIGKEHNQNKKYQCECGIKYSRKPNYLAHWRKNCLLNKNRENKVLPANCPKPPKIDNEIVIPKNESTQQNSILRAQTVGPTVLIENKPTTSIESTLGHSQGSSGTVLIGTGEVTNPPPENDVSQIIQPQVVEYHVGGPFTQTSVAFLSPGYFTS